MSQDEKRNQEDNAEPAEVTAKKKVKHKVIADVHSGLVLVAPVATPLDEVEAETGEAKPECEEPNEGPLN